MNKNVNNKNNNNLSHNNNQKKRAGYSSSLSLNSFTPMMTPPRRTFQLFSYTSAGPYPHTYWYGKDELKVKSDNHKDKFLEHYKSKINTLKCDMNIPFAGQFLLGGESSKYNEYR